MMAVWGFLGLLGFCLVGFFKPGIHKNKLEVKGENTWHRYYKMQISKLITNLPLN